MASSRDRELDAVVASINKKLKREVLVRGRDLIYHVVPRITTGSLAFDSMLGGGWPALAWNEAIGLESSGKTTALFKTIAANQALFPDWVVAWVAAEDFVPTWAEDCGVDLNRVLLAETRVMEEAFEVVDDIVASKAVDCVVVDSLPALVPNEEAEKTFNEWQVGLGARLTNKMMRKSTASGRRSLTEPERTWTGFVVNQWREKVGVMHGDSRTTPGGLGKNYAYLSRVEFRRADWLSGEGGERVGLTIAARTIKNKTFPPQRTASVDFYFKDTEEHPSGDYDTAKEVVGLALALDIVDKRGNTYTFEGEKLGIGVKKAEAYIHSDPDLLRRVWDATLAAIMVKYVPVAEVLPTPASAVDGHRVKPKPKVRLVRK